jgi:Pyruvate/2-oxoacid:ferredoxin oxidoreductase delta subunit
MRRSGLKEIGDDYGFVLADFDTGRQVFHKDALLVKSFTIASGVIDADGLISLPKLKTHGLTRITGAIKNQFGCIPGMMKSQFHLKLPDPYDFATMLVDINTFIKPRLYIMDAVMAMEGNGPRNGKPRKLGVLLFSSDPVAVDAVACLLINLNPEFVPTSKPGELSGLGTYHNDNIEIVGDELNAFIVKDFEVERSAPVHCTTGGLTKFIKNQICERPVIDKTKCTVCGTCVKMCPAVPKAIDWHTGKKDKPPFYKYEQCIRCFCCQEVCPEGAISVYKPALAKVMSRPFSI